MPRHRLPEPFVYFVDECLGRHVVPNALREAIAANERVEQLPHSKQRSIVLTTNKAFAEWPTTFPNAACVVALVDRLINRAEIVVIDGDSYRLHEAEERQRARVTARKRPKKPAR